MYRVDLSLLFKKVLSAMWPVHFNFPQLGKVTCSQSKPLFEAVVASGANKRQHLRSKHRE